MGKNSSFSISVNLLAQIQQFNKNMSSAQSTIKGFQGTVNNIGGAIAGAFTAQKIIEFTKEATLLASKAEGIERAFQKLNKPELLSQLRAATRGTVSDFELMRRSVQANNFGIELNSLAGMFEFARKRAQQTGESVEYFVESMVTGMARQSVMILDNVGISSKQIREEMKKTGDFNKAVQAVVTKGLKEMGDEGLTTADKLGQINTRVENIKVSFGKVVTESNYFHGILKEIDHYMYKIATSPIDKKMMPILGDINIDGKTAVTRLKSINHQIGNQKRGLEALVKLEGAKANLGSKDFKTEGVFDQSKVDAWAEKRIKNNDDYKLQLEVLKRLEEEKGRAEKRVNEEANKTIKTKHDTIASLGLEISSLGEMRDKAHGKELTQLNKEIKALQDKKKLLEEQGLNNTTTKDFKLMSMPEIDFSSIDDISIDDITIDAELEIENMGLIESLQNRLRQLSDLRDKSYDTSEIQGYNSQIATTNDELQKLTNTQSDSKSGAEGMASMMSNYGSVIGQVSGMMQNFQADSVQSWASMTGMILTSIGKIIPALQAQATASVVASSAKAPWPANIPAIAMGIGTVLSAFGSLPAFNSGGEISGNSFSGDKVLARVNSGETVITKNQKSDLIGMLNKPSSNSENQSGFPQDVEFKLRGDVLIGVINNTNKKRKNFS